MLYFLVKDPKNDYLFKIFFTYANGPFGLIFHKLDNLTSIAIHIIPLVTSWNLKWYTIPHESALHEDQRYFVSLDKDGGWDADFFNKIFFIPLVMYLVWVGLYYLKVFVLSSKKI
jgi:hypothetical protein